MGALAGALLQAAVGHLLIASSQLRAERGSQLSYDPDQDTNPIHKAPPSWPHLVLITSQRPHLRIPYIESQVSTYKLGDTSGRP